MTTLRKPPRLSSLRSPIKGMVRISGGQFRMGSDRHYPEEAPERTVAVGDFWIDETPVTNGEFATFITQTGYRTVAENAPDPADYPGLLPENAYAGSLVFEKTAGPVYLDDAAQWWKFCEGAAWNHPTGPDSTLEGLADHPVVHIAYADALAYAKWAGKDLPTEAEWEYAARGGRENSEFAWGDELAPSGKMMANYWQGLFPFSNLMLDGFDRTSPVKTFPANGFGLYDMIGNVWEWTKDWFANPAGAPRACCVIENPRGARESDSFDPNFPNLKIGRKVLKGGSHLCAESYCRRYRPAARHAQAIESSTSHIGFRCVLRSV